MRALLLMWLAVLSGGSLLATVDFSQSLIGVQCLTVEDFDEQTKTIEDEGLWNLEHSGLYDPIDATKSSPMIKIHSSNVTLDFQGHSVESVADSYDGYIGIEIGYCKTELEADPTLEQIENVHIKNVRLKSFDCALVINKGVKHVVIEDLEVLGCSIGIVFLGDTGVLVENQISSVTLKNCSIIGHEKDRHAALVALKNRFETTYGYGAEFVMPLRKDVLNSDTVDVHTYYGILLLHTKKIDMKDVNVASIGYADYGVMSEGNGKRTEAIGIALRNSNQTRMHHVSSADCSSELRAAGLQLEGVNDLEMYDSSCSHQRSAQRAVGVETYSEGVAPWIATQLWFERMICDLNVSPEVAIGLDLSKVKGFGAIDITGKQNAGDKQCYGIYAKDLELVDIQNSTFSGNVATYATNDIATQDGVIGCGFYGENVQSVQFGVVDLCCNYGTNSGRGMYLKNSNDCRFEDVQMVANQATMMRSGEAAAIRTEQDAQEISKLGPVVDATYTGGYGFVANTCKRMKLSNSICNSNKGHRSGGVRLVSCQSVAIEKGFAAANQATGGMLDASFYTDYNADPATVDIDTNHQSLLFSTSSKTLVDAVTATDLFLNKMTAVRTSQNAGTALTYADVKTLAATTSLLQAAIARYRLWGTSYGIQIHNSIGCYVIGTITAGQVSLLDSAAGVVFTGRNSGHLVKECNASYNIGWYLSQQTLATGGTESYTYKYDLSGMKDFWDTLTSTWTTAIDTDAIGFNTGTGGFVAQGQKDFGDGTTGDALTIQVKSPNDRVLVSPVGPIAAGLILGDLYLSGKVEGNIIHGNMANAGHGHGIVLNQGHYVTIEKNDIADNSANIYGFATGIFDVTAHSSNMYSLNVLAKNRVSTYPNSNYLIPFNPADLNTLAFPVTSMMNGNLSEPSTRLDNVEITYSQNSEFYPVESLVNMPLHPDLVSDLTTNGCWS